MKKHNIEMMGSRSISGGISKNANLISVQPSGYNLTMEMSKELFYSDYLGNLIDDLSYMLSLYTENSLAQEEATYNDYLQESDYRLYSIRYYYDEITSPYGYKFRVAEILSSISDILGSAKIIKISDMMLTLATCQTVAEFLERKPEHNDNEKAA